jgi:hypothetical protein
VDPEAAFLAGYATALLAIAAGLESLGRRSDVPVVHLGISGVALAAALLFTAVGVARHHHPIERLVQLALLALISWRIVRLRRSVAPCMRVNGHTNGTDGP